MKLFVFMFALKRVSKGFSLKTQDFPSLTCLSVQINGPSTMSKSYPTLCLVLGSQKQHNDVTSAISPPAVAHSSVAGETSD